MLLHSGLLSPTLNITLAFQLKLMLSFEQDLLIAWGSVPTPLPSPVHIAGLTTSVTPLFKVYNGNFHSSISALCA
jgi:hypothetical protein